MKPLLILLATVSIARANLIDLTPGGWDTTQPPPHAFISFVQRLVGNRITFFDAATPTGWQSQFGVLNGGTNFFTDLIGNPGPTANVSWDFSNLQGYSMSLLLVEGDFWANLYAVPRNFQITDLGEEVTLHDGVNIDFLEFYGRYPGSAPLPDSGSTLALMGIGLVFVGLTAIAWRRWKDVRCVGIDWKTYGINHEATQL